MIKNTIALLTIVAVASLSSFALAGGSCGDKKDCDRNKAEAASLVCFEVASSGCGGCSGGNRDDGDKS